MQKLLNLNLKNILLKFTSRDITFPNQLSILRIILAPVFLLLYISDNPLYKKLSVIVYVIAALTDWYDGWYARKYKMTTKVGVFLDPLADKILTSSAFLLFCIIKIMDWWMLAIIIFRDIIVTLLRSYDEYKGKTLKTSYIAKTKTFLQMTYIFVVLGLLFILSFEVSQNIYNSINSFLFSKLNYVLLLIISAITLLSGVLYFFENKSVNEINKKTKN